MQSVRTSGLWVTYGQRSREQQQIQNTGGRARIPLGGGRSQGHTRAKKESTLAGRQKLAVTHADIDSTQSRISGMHAFLAAVQGQTPSLTHTHVTRMPRLLQGRRTYKCCETRAPVVLPPNKAPVGLSSPLSSLCGAAALSAASTARSSSPLVSRLSLPIHLTHHPHAIHTHSAPSPAPRHHLLSSPQTHRRRCQARANERETQTETERVLLLAPFPRRRASRYTNSEPPRPASSLSLPQRWPPHVQVAAAAAAAGVPSQHVDPAAHPAVVERYDIAAGASVGSRLERKRRGCPVLHRHGVSSCCV